MQTNYTKLADLYAVAKAEFDKAEVKLKELREQIIETGRETLEGDAYQVTVSLSESSRINAELAKKHLTKVQLAKIYKASDVTTLRVKAALPSDVGSWVANANREIRGEMAAA